MKELFDALAEEDARTVVPAPVHDAVMRAWQARQKDHARRRVMQWAVPLAWAAVPAAAVLALAAVWLWPDRPALDCPGIPLRTEQKDERRVLRTGL